MGAGAQLDVSTGADGEQACEGMHTLENIEYRHNKDYDPLQKEECLQMGGGSSSPTRVLAS